jgi:ribonuclease VapC
MVIDTSALVAVLTAEPGAAEIEAAIDRDPHRLMAAASVLEASIVLERRFGDAGARELDLLVRRILIEVSPFDGDQLEWARYAYRTYGKGRHKAALNFGDCFSYALSKLTGEPLLFTGHDFHRTDIATVFPKG